MKQSTKNKLALERDHICTGCGAVNNLSHSHLIRISKRKDLEDEPENITYHCLSIGKTGCHDKWESNDYFQMSQLFDFEKNIKIIKMLDKPTYNFLMQRFTEQIKKEGLSINLIKNL